MNGIDRLVSMMQRLRGEDGCPWDRQQTHASLVQYLIEESYEAVEAIEGGNDAELREELGDVLFQVVFHAEIARSEGRFDFDDIAAAVADKMESRHPHVFGDAASDIESVRANWEVLKAAEAGKTERKNVDDGIPAALPALQRAQKVLGRMERRGVVTPDFVGAEMPEAPTSETELGQQLLTLVHTAREQGWDAERALREATRNLANGASQGR